MSKLHVDSVIKNYGHRKILSDIYLECYQGEVIGLLGRNGSGKSTLLEIIFGSKDAESKFVKVGDQIIGNVCDGSRFIKYLPQNSFLPNQLTAARIISEFSDEINARLIAETPSIKPMLSKKCSQLSGGEKRLLEIYLIVCSNAKYVLIDEPFNGIAPIYKEVIKDLIKQQSDNKGFIITDHDYRNILDVSTRIILLHEGNIKNINQIDELERWGYIPTSSPSLS